MTKDKPGICPKCGGKIEYRSHVTHHDEMHHIWMCPKCLTWGYECYDIVFRGHENIEELTAEMHRRMMEEG